MSRRSVGLLLCCALQGSSSIGPSIAVHAQAGEASSSVLRPALEEAQRLTAFDGSRRSTTELLRRNLSRYFALCILPANADELSRVLGTAERMSSKVTTEIYRAAEEAARQEGSEIIRRRHIKAVLRQVTPSVRTPYKEITFFPEADHPIVIEQIDLQAFYDTGFAWSLVAILAETEIRADPAALPMEPEAVQDLALGINSYGLLLLRIGGRNARLDFAPTLQSRHLRTAGKSIAQRGTDLVAEPSRFPTAAQSPPWFVDVTADSVLSFRHVSSDWIARFRRYGFTAPSFSGGGVSAGYLDDDDLIDLMVCGGQGCSVFFSQRDGTFVDATGRTGLSVDGEARMAVLADFDNDGRTDVFITYARDTNRLFRNMGGGLFQDVTADSGLERQGDISGPAVAADYDNDGRLDLFVGNFGNYLEGESPFSPNNSTNGMPNRLYRNLGGFEFRDASAGSGVGNTGWTQALSHIDYDLDGDQDFYVANDFGPNDLLINNGDGTFQSAGIRTGTDDPFHGMNVAFADLNHDRHADIFITNIWFWSPARDEVNETNSLLLSTIGDDGRVGFTRVEDPELLQHDTGWSWGSVFFDADNDADDDLYVVNGFTDYFTFAQYRQSPTYADELHAINNGREPNWLFRNDTGLPTHHVAGSGAELDGINSRGVAPVDFDGDGDLDLAVSTFHSTLRLLRNDGAAAGNHWLSVDLVGDPSQGSSRDAIGTQVIATGPEGLYVWRHRSGGEGYLSMGSPELEMGLGEHSVVDLEILWPGGQKQSFPGMTTDRRIRLLQGSQSVETLPHR